MIISFKIKYKIDHESKTDVWYDISFCFFSIISNKKKVHRYIDHKYLLFKIFFVHSMLLQRLT